MRIFFQHRPLFLAFLTLFLNVLNARSIFELKRLIRGEMSWCRGRSFSMKMYYILFRKTKNRLSIEIQFNSLYHMHLIQPCSPI